MTEKKPKGLTMDILLPTYNGGEVLAQTLKSIFSQSFKDYRIIIQDDVSNDNTEEVVKSFKNDKVVFYRNKKNLGYPGNLEEARKKATADIIYLMGQDDILANDALLSTIKAFESSEEIGAVTRPYFWFDKNIETPVRAKEKLYSDQNKDEVVKITDGHRKVIQVFKTLDQLSGLAYRRKFMDIPFHPDIFPCHIYPFASIFKKHPIVFLKDYNLAVRISSSQCRKVSSIYEKSPMKSWVEMFETVFSEKEFENLRKKCIKHFVAVNYVGLVQLRNYAKYRYLLREIFYLVKFRPDNLLSPSFWFFSLGCLITPPKILIPMVDWWKNRVNVKRFKNIKFEYTL